MSYIYLYYIYAVSPRAQQNVLHTSIDASWIAYLNLEHNRMYICNIF